MSSLLVTMKGPPVASIAKSRNEKEIKLKTEKKKRESELLQCSVPSFY